MKILNPFFEFNVASGYSPFLSLCADYFGWLLFSLLQPFGSHTKFGKYIQT